MPPKKSASKHPLSSAIFKKIGDALIAQNYEEVIKILRNTELKKESLNSIALYHFLLLFTDEKTIVEALKIFKPPFIIHYTLEDNPQLQEFFKQKNSGNTSLLNTNVFQTAFLSSEEETTFESKLMLSIRNPRSLFSCFNICTEDRILTPTLFEKILKLYLPDEETLFKFVLINPSSPLFIENMAFDDYESYIPVWGKYLTPSFLKRKIEETTNETLKSFLTLFRHAIIEEHTIYSCPRTTPFSNEIYHRLVKDIQEGNRGDFEKTISPVDIPAKSLNLLQLFYLASIYNQKEIFLFLIEKYHNTMALTFDLKLLSRVLPLKKEETKKLCRTYLTPQDEFQLAQTPTAGQVCLFNLIQPLDKEILKTILDFFCTHKEALFRLLLLNHHPDIPNPLYICNVGTTHYEEYFPLLSYYFEISFLEKKSEDPQFKEYKPFIILLKNKLEEIQKKNKNDFLEEVSRERRLSPDYFLVLLREYRPSLPVLLDFFVNSYDSHDLLRELFSDLNEDEIQKKSDSERKKQYRYCYEIVLELADLTIPLVEENIKKFILTSTYSDNTNLCFGNLFINLYAEALNRGTYTAKYSKNQMHFQILLHGLTSFKTELLSLPEQANGTFDTKTRGHTPYSEYISPFIELIDYQIRIITQYMMPSTPPEITTQSAPSTSADAAMKANETEFQFDFETAFRNLQVAIEQENVNNFEKYLSRYKSHLNELLKIKEPTPLLFLSTKCENRKIIEKIVEHMKHKSFNEIKRHVLALLKAENASQEIIAIIDPRSSRAEPDVAVTKIEEPKTLMERCKNGERAAFIEACEQNNSGAIQCYLEDKKHVVSFSFPETKSEKERRTPFSILVRNGYIANVRVLLNSERIEWEHEPDYKTREAFYFKSEQWRIASRDSLRKNIIDHPKKEAQSTPSSSYPRIWGALQSEAAVNSKTPSFFAFDNPYASLFLPETNCEKGSSYFYPKKSESPLENTSSKRSNSV